jgi:hypothetical protein
MLRTLSRAMVAAGLALLAGGLSVTAWYTRSPAYVVNFEGETPPVVSGLYRFERAGQSFFAWTSPSATWSLAGADRRGPWTCTIRARGARPPGVPPADLAVAVDGVTVDHRRLASDQYTDIAVTAPARPGADALSLTLTVSPVFVPGAADRRQLGVQLTAFSCVPAGAVLPPARAIAAGGFSTALFAAALVLSGLSLPAALAGALLLGAAAGLPLAHGPAPYGAYTSTATVASASVGLGLVLLAWATARVRRAPLEPAARAAIAITGGLLLVELLGLLHPSKVLVDAVFHAHRLEWVMDGRLLFTQPMPSGVRFPYAIALYVVSLPFAWVVDDHVTLLKVVVLVSRALAGLLLYPVVTRAWNDRRAAVAAVALFHMVPLPFVVIGNANMTYAFGQSVAVATIAVTVLVGLSKAGWRAGAGLFVVAALAFLSHVGIFPLLLTVLLASAAGFRLLGGAGLRPAATAVVAAALAAAVFSVVVYYGHFGEAYRTLARVRAAPSVSSSAPGSPAAGAPAPLSAAGARARPRVLSLGERLASTADIARRGLGWPLLAAALVGAVIWVKGGWRDPLGLVLAATLGAAAVFVAGSNLAPVEPAFWRYTAEFISRVNYVAMPALVILAARAVARAWGAGLPGRAVAVAAVLLALREATTGWLPWIG